MQIFKRLSFSSEVKNVLILFLLWRFSLTLFTVIGVYLATQRMGSIFLGGGDLNYSLAPYFFGWGNFDGEHYVSISIFGYRGLEQAFFPLYPILISAFTKLFATDLYSSIIFSNLFGMLISNISLLFALFFLWRLITLDFSENIARITITLLLLFPTSFYFSAVYTESLFLMLSVASFYYARKGKWLMSALTGGFSSVTRVIGILLFPALLIYAWSRKVLGYKLMWLLLMPCSLGVYMLYQYLTVNDPFAFYTMQHLVGEQRQSSFTTVFQVYYRYIKMFLTSDPTNPIYQTIVLEFISGILFLLLPLYGIIKKVNISYIFYALAGFFITTFQGSFSSTPRYVLVLFPSFIIAALIVSKFRPWQRLIVYSMLYFILGLETVLFLKGIWIA